MAKAVFIVQLDSGSPVWPAHFAEDGTLVIRTVSCIGQVPLTETVLGVIETVDDAGMVALKNLPDWLWVEDVPEEEVP